MMDQIYSITSIDNIVSVRQMVLTLNPQDPIVRNIVIEEMINKKMVKNNPMYGYGVASNYAGFYAQKITNSFRGQFEQRLFEELSKQIDQIFNTYGPNMDPHDGRVVSNFICQALKGENITIYGNGLQTRSFCYVDDLIEAMVRMMNSQKGFTGPVNTGNPGEFTIKELAEIAHEQGCLFHTDAVQAVPHIRINASNYDSLSLSAHKFNGPKGVGVLYLKKGVEVDNLICGGHQENSLRPGTENVAGIVGLAEAMKITNSNLDVNNIKERKLRDYLLSLISKIPGFVLNGEIDRRINSNINFCFEDIDSDELKLFLEMNNIYVSTGSACNSQIKDISHVLKSIGSKKAGIRISLSYENNMYEMNKIAYAIEDSVKVLRRQRGY